MNLEASILLIRDHMTANLKSLAQAAEAIRPLIGDDDVVDQAVKILNKRMGDIEDLRDPVTVSKRDFVPWYAGPNGTGKFWQLLRDYLADVKGWDEDTVGAIDTSSTKVISQLPFPGDSRFSGRGLVVGYVQSGKTANFTAVISKAADVGFRLIVVLSGMTNSLRQQTQERMESDLIERAPDDWFKWTDVVQDIGDLPISPGSMLSTVSRRNLAIVKKESTRLNRLLQMLKDTDDPILRSCPVLIIDDECDQASVNSASLDRERTTINRLLVEILEELPRVAYIGYTATPYANVLIDPGVPEDLYPRDFIIDLPRPDAYFGAERLFGRDLIEADIDDDDPGFGYDMIRYIKREEEPLLRPKREEKETWSITVTASLRRAMLYFWIASSVRALRGQSDAPSSMLIHTTHYAAPHVNSRVPIERFRDRIASSLRSGDQELIDEICAIWEKEEKAVDCREFGFEPTDIGSILSILADTVSATRLFVENGQSDQRLESFEGPGIVVGGNILARGLTIDGLVCSFFLRTTSMYDSLMQMGRWFGYRIGYQDLPRVWMTKKMESDFRDLATVEHEIRQDIARYRDDGSCTPLDVAVRIRLHPHMEVTAKTKQRSIQVVGKKSFEGRRLQTTRFRVQDDQWLKNNLDAGAELVRQAENASGAPETSNKNGFLFRRVPWPAVQSFFEGYSIHESHEVFSASQIVSYVEHQNQFETRPLELWNVGIVRSRTKDAPEREGFGSLPPVAKVSRTTLKNMGHYIDIGVLFSASHMKLDLPDAGRGLSGAWEKLKEVRGPFDGTAGRLVEEPLLLLYLIDRNSKPEGKAALRRTDLNAVNDVLGMGVVFPQSEHITPVEYVTAPVGPEFAEMLEDLPEFDDETSHE